MVGSSVNGYTYVGGLAGYVGTNNTVQNCSFTGAVSGTYEVGGLLGASNATVVSCYSEGTVNGGLGEQAGGLIGQNLYNVNMSYSTASVSGSYNNGGLVGENEGTIQNCFATGGTSGAYSTGGLVGENDDGIIKTSYSTGSVSGNSNIGGLVGQNDSFIYNCYTTGTVSGAAPFSVYLGGLVGVNNNLVQNCYSTGAVSGTLGVGGLVGYNSNSITACYWANDVGNNGILSTAAYNTYGTIDSYTMGVPLASMKLQSTFAPAGSGVGQWDFTNTWTTGGDTTTPLLKSLSFNLSGSTSSGDTVDLIANGTLLQSKTATGGNYSFLVPADVLNGALITDASSNTSNTFYNGGFIPIAGTSVTGVNLLANALTIQGAGLSSNTQLGTATGGLSAGTDGIAYTVDTSHNLSTNSGIAISIQSPYVVDGNITATSAELSTGNAAPLTATASSATLSASGIVLGSSLNSSGTILFNSASNIFDTGSVNVGAFILQNGYWGQYTSGGTLPGFSVTNDFELQNSSTFLRIVGGNGTSVPYGITDIYGLEGIGSPSHIQLGYNYVLAQNIDASGTATWNYSGGIYGGFVPIGGQGGNNPYTGTFNGDGFSINGLTINQPSGEFVGLFGYTYAGTVENMALLGGSITGDTEVGSLIGLEGFGATLQTSFSTASVSGFNSVGGLVGGNEGTVEQSFATGAVSVSTEGSYGGIINAFGGLVGANIGTMENCYATGNVTGATEYAGGLVGYNGNSGIIGTSYSTGSVTGGSGSYSIGGFLGGNSGTVQSNYWLQDTGINTGLSGIGDASSNAGATPESLAALKLQSTYIGFNFALGTGVWGINGYNDNGLINNGLPYFQWQYATQAEITPYSQHFYYDGTTGNLDQSEYSVAYNPNNLVGENSLNALLSAGPTFSIVGSNVNVVTSTPNTVATSITVIPGYAVEVNTTPATVTYTPQPITVVATSGQTIVYGTATAVGNASFTYTTSGLTGTDSLSGSLGGYALGYTVDGSPYTITLGSLSNSNYTIAFASANYSVIPGTQTTPPTTPTTPTSPTQPTPPVQPTSPVEPTAPPVIAEQPVPQPTENNPLPTSNFSSFQVAYKAPFDSFSFQTSQGDSRYAASYLPKADKHSGMKK